MPPVKMPLSACPTPLQPGAWLGVLGGGQLGRMFCMAAQRLGYRVFVLDPAEAPPASGMADRFYCADFSDPHALRLLRDSCNAVTVELENLPVSAIEFLAERCIVSPGASALAITQDRIAEKRFIRQNGFATAPYAEIFSDQHLQDAQDSLFPGILKLAQSGYDGKGQLAVSTRASAMQAFSSWGERPCVLEKALSISGEISVVLCRGSSGACAAFPVASNTHCNGVLVESLAPAKGDGVEEVVAITKRLAESLDYVGVLCVEFFLHADPETHSPCVNEIAPRPHNSGHYTIDACLSSQFEQQVRITAGLPLGACRQHTSAVMLNILGDCWFPLGGLREGLRPTLANEGGPHLASLLQYPQVKFHWYGKELAYPGRKMGHVTILDDGTTQAKVAMDSARCMLCPSGGD